MSSSPSIIAYRTGAPFDVPIVPAPRVRAWMSTAMARSAKRCLPILMANQAGWVLLNSRGFEATWDGDERPDTVRFEWDDPPLYGPAPVVNNFGAGVLSWLVPYLFRTSAGWNLLVRGPANHPRDGMSPLEGLVETDWAVTTFTMNWKLTRPGHQVRFEKGEPFCMVVPQRRGELEAFGPSIAAVEDDRVLHEHTVRWAKNRHEIDVRKFIAEYSRRPEDDFEPWELDYFRGRLPDGSAEAPEHQTRLRLASFEADEGTADAGSERAGEASHARAEQD